MDALKFHKELKRIEGDAKAFLEGRAEIDSELLALRKEKEELFTNCTHVNEDLTTAVVPIQAVRTCLICGHKFHGEDE